MATATTRRKKTGGRKVNVSRRRKRTAEESLRAAAGRVRLVLDAVSETVHLLNYAYPDPMEWIRSRFSVELREVCRKTCAALGGKPVAIADARRALVLMYEVMPHHGRKRSRDCISVRRASADVVNVWLAVIEPFVKPLVVTIDVNDKSVEDRVPVTADWTVGE